MSGRSSVHGKQASRLHVARCGWFWAWVVAGGVAALAFVVAGMLAVLPILVLFGLLGVRGPRDASRFGVLTGIGSLALAVAYLQRGGPGTTCWRTAAASGCDNHLDPRPWFVVGVVLVLAGVFAYAWRGRR
jgi:hypothetical protein